MMDDFTLLRGRLMDSYNRLVALVRRRMALVLNAFIPTMRIQVELKDEVHQVEFMKDGIIVDWKEYRLDDFVREDVIEKFSIRELIFLARLLGKIINDAHVYVEQFAAIVNRLEGGTDEQPEAK